MPTAKGRPFKRNGPPVPTAIDCPFHDSCPATLKTASYRSYHNHSQCFTWNNS